MFFMYGKVLRYTLPRASAASLSRDIARVYEKHAASIAAQYRGYHSYTVANRGLKRH